MAAPLRHHCQVNTITLHNGPHEASWSFCVRCAKLRQSAEKNYSSIWVWEMVLHGGLVREEHVPWSCS